MKARTCRVLLPWTLLLVFALATSMSAATKHVYGTNTYPQDPQNVQAALDAIQAGGKVVLHGQFNFGQYDWGNPEDKGCATMSKRDVTLAGEDNAKIIGGGKFIQGPGLFYFICVINVEATGVQVQNLELEGSPDTGILVWVLSSTARDKPITIQDSKISATWADVFCTGTACPLTIKGNTVKMPYGGYGILAYQKQGLLEIKGNRIEGTAEAWGVYATENLGPVSIKDNIVAIENSAWSQGIHACISSDVVSIKGNIVGGAGVGIHTHNYSTTANLEIKDNSVVASKVESPDAWYPDIASMYNACPVSIKGNSVRALLDKPDVSLAPVHAAIWVFGFDFTGDPEDPTQSNPPVSIKENSVDIRFPFPGDKLESMGIWLGGGGVGVDNVRVEGNKITGRAMAGIVKNEYGKNNLIKDNDLSGLKTWWAQVAVHAAQTAVRDNTFGFANGIEGTSTAVELASRLQFAGNAMPFPTENCVIKGNDYRRTGLPGWSPGKSGCVHVFSYGDKSVGGGTEVKNNLIAETGMFPKGTGVKEQVLVESSGLVHDNTVVGLGLMKAANTAVVELTKSVTPLGSISSAIQSAGAAPSECDRMKTALEKKLSLRNGALGKSALDLARGTSTLPSSCTLLGNYPNPFNPSTTIRYGLPQKSTVQLTVFNTLGQEVAQLVNGEVEAGYHEVRFDASGLSSGVYFYRLQAGTYVETRRLLLLR